MGNEAFRELSAIDPKGNDLLDKVGVSPFHIINATHVWCSPWLRSLLLTYSQAMDEDKSNEWFAEHNRQKAAA